MDSIEKMIEKHLKIILDKGIKIGLSNHTISGKIHRSYDVTELKNNLMHDINIFLNQNKRQEIKLIIEELDNIPVGNSANKYIDIRIQELMDKAFTKETV